MLNPTSVAVTYENIINELSRAMSLWTNASLVSKKTRIEKNREREEKWGNVNRIIKEEKKGTRSP